MICYYHKLLLTSQTSKETECRLGNKMQTFQQGVIFYILYLSHTVSAVSPAQENCIGFESTYHLDRACECVVYQSYGGSQGKFTSPNFPQIYPRNINCILYTFIGDIGEIIELTFLEFDLDMPRRGVCNDYLRFYLDLDRPEVNERNHWNYERCGNITMLEQKVVYSSGRSLILEFHSDLKPANHTGFRGIFRFLDEKQFMTDCIRELGTACTYYCQSNNLTKTGKFFSPRYPQNYSPGTSCQYMFRGLPGEKIRVVFQNIQLYHIGGSCENSPDVIVVHDGVDKAGPVKGRYCDVRNQVEIISSSQFLYIDFYTDEHNQRQGFAATYEFCSNCYNPMNPPHNPSTDWSYITTAAPHSIVTSPEQKGPFNCDQVFKSNVTKNGTFSSPDFPNSYPKGIQCRFTFVGSNLERVQIKFTHMDLFYPGGNPLDPHDCEGSDSVSVYVMTHGELSDLGKHCGKRIPKMVMSHQPKLTVVFTSVQSSPSVTGFKASFQFLTNFGITTGRQDKRYECGFNYYSAVNSEGVFTSPNYPGFYPRNTTCHYRFYGKKDEEVIITFQEFDVDGIPPRCQADTDSDFLEFSNFNTLTPDRKMRRYCGSSVDRLSKKQISSDGEFFRVTFQSNEVFDGTGFKATYRFITTKDKLPADLPASSNPSKVSGGALRLLPSKTLLLLWILLLRQL
ncbi:suppressor of lurcher protein 1-like isoform X2 [Liolophura sinensis]|uniref:suppressor of lurcher protein 1-like isoform X2 n=1 Tax=Liolophura sinensis TaxID=3198878 RepID=UPI003158ADA0